MVLAFGYPQDPEAAFSPAAKAGGRLPVDEIIHYEHWNSRQARRIGAAVRSIRLRRANPLTAHESVKHISLPGRIVYNTFYR